MSAPASVDLAPVATLLVIGGAFAIFAFAWVWWRAPARSPHALLRALTWATLFLTFDLVLFGAFTRLTDSGLGCPDWPGCYGHPSPVGASAPIEAAQRAIPTGAVTHRKAWIEMTHRYLATGVGALIVLLLGLAVVAARRGQGRRAVLAAGLTLAWVCLQGAFGAWTVTLKLYPAVVSLHLLGGIGLLVLLAVQTQSFEPPPIAWPPALRLGAWALAALLLVQVALGAWVSTNYAVLACTDLPTCQGRWWPDSDFRAGFTLLRPLGAGRDGGFLPFAALTAIHLAHRLGALVLLLALAAYALVLARHGGEGRRWAARLAALAAWQLCSGLSNVVLDWPLAAALAHTGGAAALAALLAALLTRMSGVRRIEGTARLPAPMSASAAP
jgi:cytochrome c oxidase assembly protein subunit 15